MPAGRPTKYKSEYCGVVKKMCELGATMPEIAEALGVVRSTVNLWAVQHVEFSDALQLGRAPADDRVERSLYERAIGYEAEEDDIRVADGEIVITPTIKRYPPDTKAALAWLYNRRPQGWHPAPTNQDDEEDSTPTKIQIEVVDARKKDP